MKDSIINLSDLVKDRDYRYQDMFYIELIPKYKKELFKTIIKEGKTIKNISKKVKVSFTRLWDQLKRVPFSIEILNKLSNYLIKKGNSKFSMRYIEKNILYIKSSGSKSQRLYYPRFPINLKTKEGVRFLAHLYHDGGIGALNKQPLYVNQSKKEVLQFLEDGKKLFGDFDRNIKKGYGNGKKKKLYYFINLPTVIGNIMIKFGYKAGDKIKYNSKVFNFMKNLKDKKLICEYLAKAFNDECHVKDREIILTQASLIKTKAKPSNILSLNKILLERISIKVNGPRLTKIYKNRYGLTAVFSISISSKENLNKFYKNIKLIKHKRDKLRRYLIGA